MLPIPAKALASPSYFCFLYAPVGKSRAFQETLKVLKRASLFKLTDDHVIAGLKKTKRDARLLVLSLTGIKHVRGHLCFIGGEPERIDWRLINVLHCYSKSFGCGKTYCLEESESDSLPYLGYRTNPVTLKPEPVGSVGEQVTFISPCKDLSPFISLSSKLGKFEEQILSVAKRKRQALCPRFDHTRFQLMLKEAKRYW